MTDIRAAAEIIATARRGRAPLQPLAGDAAPEDEAEGYQIQDAVHGLLAADFGAQAGYKIGCTSAVMQQYLDIPHPCGGGVFAKGVHDSGVSLHVAYDDSEPYIGNVSLAVHFDKTVKVQ